MQAFPQANDCGIESDVGIVQEYLVVYFTDVDQGSPAGDDGFDGSVEFKRNFQIAGKVIEGTERKNTELRAAPYQCACDRIYGPISTAADNDIIIALGGALRNLRNPHCLADVEELRR